MKPSCETLLETLLPSWETLLGNPPGNPPPERGGSTRRVTRVQGGFREKGTRRGSGNVRNPLPDNGAKFL